MLKQTSISRYSLELLSVERADLSKAALPLLKSRLTLCFTILMLLGICNDTATIVAMSSEFCAKFKIFARRKVKNALIEINTLHVQPLTLS